MTLPLEPYRVAAYNTAHDSECTACGFWVTGLNPTRRWQQFEAACAGTGLG